MEGSSTPRDRRTFTPAVLASALFVAACAFIAISFVAARGGLQLPIAAAEPSALPSGTMPPGASPTPQGSPEPSAAAVASAPPVTIPPPTTPPASPVPTDEPAPGATTPPWESVAPGDPLLALPRCPDQPGCFVYRIQRGDTLSNVASRYRIPVSTVLALNPEIADAGAIVVGQPLYLARNPFVRLERCPADDPCWLYTIRPGDVLSGIAFRHGLTVDAILDANPAIANPSAIYSGQVIRLPEPV